MNAKILKLTLCLMVIMSVFSNSVSNDFLRGYFKSIKGASFDVDHNCLSDEIAGVLIKDIVNSILKEEYLQLMKSVLFLLESQYKFCPVDEIKQLISDFYQSSRSGSLFRNVLSNMGNIGNIIKNEGLSALIESYKMGRMLGKITKIAVFGSTLSHLGNEDELTKVIPKYLY